MTPHARSVLRSGLRSRVKVPALAVVATAHDDLETDLGEQNNIADTRPDLVARVGRILKAAHAESEHWPTPGTP